jgi:hypothetical protein
MDYARAFGRGIGCYRLTRYYTHGVWNVNGVFDAGDLRRSSTHGNWMLFDSLRYNNLPRTNQWYGMHVMLSYNGNMLYDDTLRDYSHGWPHYKYYILDKLKEANRNTAEFNGLETTNGEGNASHYIFRLAEAYLLRAECKYYLGEDAASDVNEIRSRAHCNTNYASVTIGDIMDERARELYMEEWRHCELNRVGRCLALSSKPDEWGNTYDIANYDKGDTYWWRRIEAHNNFYNKGAVNARGVRWVYNIAKHNIYFPIPNSVITSNNKFKIAQNYGYAGYDPSDFKWDTWQQAAADE